VSAEASTPHAAVSGKGQMLRLLAIILVVYISIEAALARWSTPTSILFGGLAHLITWLSCSVWGASVIRAALPGPWRPFIGVPAFLLLLVGLFVVAGVVHCVVDPRGCFY
jgi:hypothetical protein